MANITPIRIQRKRTKGYNMQAESMAINGLPAKSCTRPGKWGNPFKVGDYEQMSLYARDYVRWHFKHFMYTPTSLWKSLRYYEHWLKKSRLDLEPLRGYNLACFCALDAKCHVDIILRRLYG